MYLGMLLSSYGPFWQTFVVDFKAIALSVQAIDVADCQKVIAHSHRVVKMVQTNEAWTKPLWCTYAV